MENLYKMLDLKPNASEKDIALAIKKAEEINTINFNIGYIDAERYHKTLKILAEAKVLLAAKKAQHNNHQTPVTYNHSK